MEIKAKSKVLSIVINNEFIKICELTKTGKTIMVHKAITVPTPERSYNDGMIRDRGTLAKKIKVALDDNRITTTNVEFSVASAKIAIKEVIIPNVKVNKIAEIINMNATEYFPVNIDEYIIQYSVLEHLIDDENKIKVQVMAAPSEMIDAYYDLASTLGLKIDAVDYVGNSTYQALKRQVDNKPSVVIQVENDSTSINIFNNNVLQLQRTIPYGKSVLVNAVMDEFSLKYEPALKRLQTDEMLHGSFDGDPITESLKYLCNNVNRVIDYYITRNANKPIEKAYLIGNATTIKGFVALFEHQLSLPLEGIDTLKDVLSDKKTYVDETQFSNYITNIGALIAPVNFVPRKVVAKENSRDYGKSIKLLLMVSIIASILLVSVPFFMLISSKSKRDRMQDQVNAIKSIEDVVNEYYQAKDMASDVLGFQLLTGSNDDVLSAFIKSLETQLPTDVSITSMNVANGVVTISGGASSKSSVALTAQQLSAVENITSVKIGNETEAKDDNNVVTVNFSLTCQFSNSQSAAAAASSSTVSTTPTAPAAASSK